jgi:hypothetical protein
VWPWWNEPVVIVGNDERAVRVIRSLLSRPIGFAPVAVLSDERVSPVGESDRRLENVPVAGGIGRAADVARAGIRVALIGGPVPDNLYVLDELQKHFRHVVQLREYDDLPVEGIQIRALGSLVGIEYTSNLLLPGNRAVKRALDIVVAVAGVTVSAPLMAVAAALVLILDGAPVFYSQSRTGINGRRIKVPRFGR